MSFNIRRTALLLPGVLVMVILSCTAEGTSTTTAPARDDTPGEARPAGSVPIEELVRLRPTTVEELVAGSDVIFVGTVENIVAEREIGPYGPDGTPDATLGPLYSVTDYEVTVEKVMRGDVVANGFDVITLRMPGRAAPEAGFALSVAAVLPEPGERLLFLLTQNPDGTYGGSDERLMIIDGAPVRFHDGIIFGSGITGDRLLADIETLLAG